jgi:hypothetical protein
VFIPAILSILFHFDEAAKTSIVVFCLAAKNATAAHLVPAAFDMWHN